MAACVDKHYAVVQHNAAHSMGEALAAAQTKLNAMSSTIMGAVPAQIDAMTAQKNTLDQVYTSTVNLYVNGPL